MRLIYGIGFISKGRENCLMLCNSLWEAIEATFFHVFTYELSSPTFPSFMFEGLGIFCKRSLKALSCVGADACSTVVDSHCIEALLSINVNVAYQFATEMTSTTTVRFSPIWLPLFPLTFREIGNINFQSLTGLNKLYWMSNVYLNSGVKVVNTIAEMFEKLFGID